jgi:hypothetical protein
MAEKVVLLVVDGVLGNPPVQKRTYPSLDALAARAQTGYVSTFSDCPDTITQLIGVNHYSLDNLKKQLGPMKLSILKDKSSYSAELGDIVPITGLSIAELFELIQRKLTTSNVIVVEVVALKELEELVTLLLPGLDSANVAICAIVGFADGAAVPHFAVAPVVDPSWKVIGPDVVAALSVDRPGAFLAASKVLTRTDKVQAFDEADIAGNCGMGVLPICQLFREYSYYTGSSWKYGA